MCDSNLNFFNLRFTDKTNFSNRHYGSCILIRHITHLKKREGWWKERQISQLKADVWSSVKSSKLLLDFDICWDQSFYK